MKKIAILFMLLASTNVSAAKLPNIDKAKKLASDVMALVAKGKTDKGLELTKPYLIIPESEFNVMVEQLKMQQPMIDQRFGQTIGVELINEELVGESFLKITYAQKFEKHAMRWLFYFYKSSGGWVLNTFNTDDKIQLLFSK